MSVSNWYLESFGSGNSVPVAITICLSLTKGFYRATSLPYNFLVDFLSVIF
ncbi:hypothetical protein Hanom_Chr08g00753131 [Helianthus anomalus]